MILSLVNSDSGHLLGEIYSNQEHAQAQDLTRFTGTDQGSFRIAGNVVDTKRRVFTGVPIQCSLPYLHFALRMSAPA
jgi:hypothetical protein